jgi:isoleucyl-tRNA synthetase
MGYWIDMDNPYITYDNRYIETLWWLLKQLYNKGLLYEGYTIQPYSPAAGTGLSSHELNQPGCYRDVKDTTCIALFNLIRNEKSEFLFRGAGAGGVKTGGADSGGAESGSADSAGVDAGCADSASDGSAVLTLTACRSWHGPPPRGPCRPNTALAVGPDITYVRVNTTNPTHRTHHGDTGPRTCCQLSSPLTKSLNTRLPEIQGLRTEGIEYEQLIDWVNPGDGAFRVITAIL